jgi:PTS system nitrogen regulatory IIA component
MKIGDFLSNTDVLIGVSASDKDRLLRQLSFHAANELGLDPSKVSEAIAKREALGSTGVGNGVAIPHARVSNLKKPFGLLARLRHSIDFQAVDDQPVDIVFMLLIPDAADSAQLNALACIARKLRDVETLRDVRRAGDRESLFDAITQPSVAS